MIVWSWIFEATTFGEYLRRYCLPLIHYTVVTQTVLQLHCATRDTRSPGRDSPIDPSSYTSYGSTPVTRYAQISTATIHLDVPFQGTPERRVSRDWCSRPKIRVYHVIFVRRVCGARSPPNAPFFYKSNMLVRIEVFRFSPTRRNCNRCAAASN